MQEQQVSFESRLYEAKMWCYAQKRNGISIDAKDNARFFEERRQKGENANKDNHMLSYREQLKRSVFDDMDDWTWKMRSIYRERETLPVLEKGGVDREEGRILVFSPLDSLDDGAAFVASDGYFDVYNAPPWYTWITCKRGEEMAVEDQFSFSILSWVPYESLERVAKGIDANPEQCLLWATMLDTPYVQWLKKEGLL